MPMDAPPPPDGEDGCPLSMDGEAAATLQASPLAATPSVLATPVSSNLAAMAIGLAAPASGLAATAIRLAAPSSGLDQEFLVCSLGGHDDRWTARTGTTTTRCPPGGRCDCSYRRRVADAMSNALALARTLLSTAPPPVVEYNVPVVDVQRSEVDHVERVDCDSFTDSGDT